MNNKSEKVSIVVFIDALGWEVLRNRRFLEDELPFGVQSCDRCWAFPLPASRRS